MGQQAQWVEEAEYYLDAKDYIQALPLLQHAADAGNTDAMYYLGALYAKGHGVAQDYGKARQWYQKAADAGDKPAKYELTRLPKK
jgi:TPR repeat protein